MDDSSLTSLTLGERAGVRGRTSNLTPSLNTSPLHFTGGQGARTLPPQPLSPPSPAARWIGTDEAGYGPNLGPLVISTTSWELPAPGPEFDLYAALSAAVDRDSNAGGAKLHLADSKQVYSPGRGLASLETSALALLAQTGPIPRTFQELAARLTGEPLRAGEGEPWLRSEMTALPVAASLPDVERLAASLRATCAASGVRLTVLSSDMVETPRFNAECAAAGSKGVVLSRTTLKLLERHWPADAVPTLVTCDKHGGRNQYAALLSETFGDLFIPCLEESPAISRYKLRGGEVRFQVRAEQFLPTAAASILSKYLREIAMEQFNAFWGAQVRGLKPTKGYPEDARRFRTEIAHQQREFGIPDAVLWRER